MGDTLKKLFLLLAIFVSYCFITSATSTSTRGWFITGTNSQTVACTGSTTTGPQSDPPANAYAPGTAVIAVQRITLPSSCNRVSVNLSVLQKYGDDATHQIELGFYADNGSGTDPAALIGNYGAFYTAAAGSNYILDPDPEGFSQQLSNTDTYVWVAVMIQDVGIRIGYDSTADVSRRLVNTWGSWPDPWPTGSDIEDADRQYGFKIHWE